MDKNELKKIRNLIVVSQDTRLNILGALFSTKVQKIRPLLFEELKESINESNENKIKEHLSVLKESNLVNTRRMNIKGRSVYEVFEITEDGIGILNELGINEIFVKSIEV